MRSCCCCLSTFDSTTDLIMVVSVFDAGKKYYNTASFNHWVTKSAYARACVVRCATNQKFFRKVDNCVWVNRESHTTDSGATVAKNLHRSIRAYVSILLSAVNKVIHFSHGDLQPAIQAAEKSFVMASRLSRTFCNTIPYKWMFVILFIVKFTSCRLIPSKSLLLCTIPIRCV